MTAEIVSAYVMGNAVRPIDLPMLVSTVDLALKQLAGREALSAAVPVTPAVPIKKSVTPDFLISLEDGKPYKSLKRHLTGRGITPDQYREKWGLPSDYPMVAASYAERRSQIAKALGLGQLRRKAAAPNGAAGEAASEERRRSKAA